MRFATSEKDVLEAIKRVSSGKGKITSVSKEDVSKATQEHTREYPRTKFIEKVKSQTIKQEDKEKLPKEKKKLKTKPTKKKVVKKKKKSKFFTQKLLSKPKKKLVKSLSAKKVIQQLAKTTSPRLVRGHNPNQINGYFRDEWIKEKNKKLNWLYSNG